MTAAEERAARDDRIVRMSRQGVFVEEIARRTGVTERTVTRVRVAYGLAAPKQKVTEAQLDRARRLMEEGESREVAAAAVGVAPKSLAQRFPDLKWSNKERAQAAAFARQMKKLERRLAA